jgi:hypothetical protein
VSTVNRTAPDTWRTSAAQHFLKNTWYVAAWSNEITAHGLMLEKAIAEEHAGG